MRADVGRRPGARWALVLAAVLAIGTTACSSSGGDPSSASSSGPSGATSDVGAPRRFSTAEQISAAVLAAVRAKGSVLITTTAEGTTLVSTRSVQLTPAGEDSLSRVSVPGQDDQSLLVDDDVPYEPLANDPLGKHWMKVDFDQLSATSTWSTAAYVVDLPTELGSWRLATQVRGGDVGLLAGEKVRTYVLTIGPKAAAAQFRLDRVKEADRASVQSKLAQIQYDISVVLGTDDLPRTVTTVAPASGLTKTQTYSQWGKVSVPVPTPDDVQGGS